MAGNQSPSALKTDGGAIIVREPAKLELCSMNMSFAITATKLSLTSSKPETAPPKTTTLTPTCPANRFGQQDFDGNGGVQSRVAGFVDLTHAT